MLNGPEAIEAQAGMYPPHVKDQLSMDGDLVYNTPWLTDDQLYRFFKDASFGVQTADIDRVYSPTAGVTVIRDRSFGVPHIFGETRYATMFAQGYTAAEDRLFLMDALRHVGRGRVSEFLGAAPVPHLQSLNGANGGSTGLTYSAGAPAVANNRTAVSTMPMDRRIIYAA